MLSVSPEGVLISCVLLVVSQWGSYDELRCAQDGAPHFALSVCAWLDEHVTAQWIGHGGQQNAPILRYVTLFFLWGCAEGEVKNT